MSKKLLGTHEIPLKAKFVLQPTATPATAGSNNASGDQLVFALAADKSLYYGAQLKTDHIADSQITTAKIANDAVDGDKIAMGSDTQGDIMVHGSGTAYERLAKGSSGHYLKAGSSTVAYAQPVLNLDADSKSGSPSANIDATLTITGGEGIDTSAAGAAITISGEDATEDQLITLNSAMTSLSGVADIKFSEASSGTISGSGSVVPSEDALRVQFGGSGSGSAFEVLKAYLSLSSDGSISNTQFSFGDAGGNSRIFNVTAASGTSSGPIILTVAFIESVGSSPGALHKDDMKSAVGFANIRIPGNKGIAKYEAEDFVLSSGRMSLEAAQTNLTSVKNNSLVVGRASGSDEISFGTDGQIQLKTASTSRLVAKDAGVDIAGQLDVTGSVGVSGNIVLQGNLVVDGETVEIVGETVQMKDTLMELGMEDDGSDGLRAPTAVTSKDLGVMFHRHNISGTTFTSPPSGLTHSSITTASLDGSTTTIAFSSLSGMSSAVVLAGSLLKVTSSGGFRVYRASADINSSTTSVAVTVDATITGQASGAIGSFTALEVLQPAAKIDAFFRDQSDSGKFKLMKEIAESSGVISGSSFADLKVAGMESSSLAVSGAASVSGDTDIAGLSMTGKLDAYAGASLSGGKLLIADGADFELGDISAGSGIDVAYAANAITVSRSKATVSSKLLHCEFGADGKLDAVYKDSADFGGSPTGAVLATGASSGQFASATLVKVDDATDCDFVRTTTSMELASSHGKTINAGDLLQVLDSNGKGLEFIANENIGATTANVVSLRYVQDVGTSLTLPIDKSTSGANMQRYAATAHASSAAAKNAQDELSCVLGNDLWFGSSDAPGLNYRAEVDRLVPDTSAGAVCWEQDSSGVQKKSDLLEIDLMGLGDGSVLADKYVTIRVQVVKYFNESGTAS